MWNLYGNVYDLTDFMDLHPGGRDIIHDTMNKPDITGLFISSHALHDKSKILKILEKYKVPNVESELLYEYDTDGFYDVLIHRVKTHLEQNNIQPKCTLRWKIQYLCMMVLIIACLTSDYKCLSFCAGMLNICSNFWLLHESSHGSFSSSKLLNNIACQLSSTLVLFSNDVWNQHHNIHHHAYTNDPTLDLDATHLPHLTKRPNDCKKRISKMKFYIYLLGLIFPGFWIGQIMSYAKTFVSRSHFTPLNAHPGYMFWLSYLLFFWFICAVKYKFVYFMLGGNVMYGSTILVNHDTFEIATSPTDQIRDWGSLQVLHTSNYHPNPIFKYIITDFVYQIEHHLFPTLGSHAVIEIAPIVKQTCMDFNLPYQQADSWWIGTKSAIKTLYFSNVKRD
jgi:linoleoyl-CoA desaturase